MPVAITNDTILIADDDVAERRTRRALLEEAGFRVIEAGTAADALARILSDAPDLLLLDLDLPDRSGFDVCRQIKTDPVTSSVMVLQISATARDTASRVRALEGGADGYLTEPVAPEELKATIVSLLRLRRALALEDRVRLQAELLDQAHDAIFVRDLDRRIVYWNQGAAEMYGIERKDALGRNAHELLHTRFPVPIDALESALREKGGWNGELAHTRKDGTEIQVESRHALVRNSHGEPTGILEINRDVTERKRAEAALHRSLDRIGLLHTVTAQLSEAVTPAAVADVVLTQCLRGSGAYAGAVMVRDDQDSRLLKAIRHFGYDDSIVRAFGETPIEAPTPMGIAVRTGTPVYLETPEAWTQMAAAIQPRNSGSPTRAVAAVPLHGDRRVIGALVLSFRTMIQLSDEDKTFLAAIARHCALALERAVVYEEAQRARAEAERSNRLKDEFLATVSHELRTPLNSILGWVQMLMSGAVPVESRQHALETVFRNAQAQTRLIEDVLDVSRIITGKLRLDVSEVDVTRVLSAAIDAIRPAATGRGIEIVSRIEPGRLVVLGDPNRLQQVFWNLLSNAVKFTPERGNVSVTVRRATSGLEVAVTDNGVGIDPQFLPRVFDRFSQFDGSTTRKHSGLGLGLAIVRHLVELHGGSVAADSAGAGRGATFSVRLPIRAVAQVESVEPRTPGRGGTSVPTGRFAVRALEGVSVLVVDDEADARDLLDTVLRQQGADVRIAASAEEALEHLQRHVPTVLVSDIGMPRMDGLELIRLVRAMPAERGGDVPAIALTAYGRDEDRARVLAAGFQVHATKPVLPSELVTLVSTIAGAPTR